MSCGECSDALGVIFYFPGKWQGGLCEKCARRLHGAAFTEHYGEVRLVTDGDAGKGQAKT